jgi:ankyrin repeat protein
MQAVKSTKLQLLVVLLATLISAAFFAVRDLPPTRDVIYACMTGDIENVHAALHWGFGLGPIRQFGLVLEEEPADVVSIPFTVNTKGSARNTSSPVNPKVVIHENVTLLHDAVQANRKEVAELLVTHGADVNATDSLGWTPLHYAARKGNKGIAEWLIAKGAAINAKDCRGRTPLQYAIEWNQTEIADLLRRHRAKE